MFNNFKSTTVDGFYYLSKWHPFIIYNLKEERQKCFDMDIYGKRTMDFFIVKRHGYLYATTSWMYLSQSVYVLFLFPTQVSFTIKKNDEKLLDSDYLILQITVLKTFIVLYCWHKLYILWCIIYLRSKSSKWKMFCLIGFTGA